MENDNIVRWCTDSRDNVATRRTRRSWGAGEKFVYQGDSANCAPWKLMSHPHRWEGGYCAREKGVVVESLGSGLACIYTFPNRSGATHVPPPTNTRELWQPAETSWSNSVVRAHPDSAKRGKKQPHARVFKRGPLTENDACALGKRGQCAHHEFSPLPPGLLVNLSTVDAR